MRIAEKEQARERARKKAESSMGSFREPMTAEELRQIAAEKFEEAAALPPGPAQQKIITAATGLRHAADVKSWLASELWPPK
ncbi:hypothetical protein [Bradyrhizobium sp.]|uniref:hypothetical protein n=1 Tax=Bradyrhizobium sp. TaxID=376 RepID=UPI0025B7CC16|nr:hypothetical protein [Bradyrhizobium sp.]